MSNYEPLGIDPARPPFDRLKGLRWLSAARSGHESHANVRHQLYAGAWTDNPVGVLIKVTSKPGHVYEQALGNEIAILETINQRVPDSPYFPFAYEHGYLEDGRLYLMMSLFDEFPLATTVGGEPEPHRLVAHLRTAIEVARALAAIHAIGIFHVDLNPMNILYRAERGRPVIRIVDFESAYDRARHGAGEFYSPPTTPGFTAPEAAERAPDARSDLFSLGAVLYALLSGDLWVAQADLAPRIGADGMLDPDLRAALLKAVASEPSDRYASVAAFQRVLASYLEHIWPGGTA